MSYLLFGTFQSYETVTLKYKEAVLRIRDIFDIFVWIRMRILGSVPLTNGSGSGRFLFTFRLVDGRIRIRTNNLRIRIQEVQKHTDPTDLEHRKEGV
jgi:hypothetical protein